MSKTRHSKNEFHRTLARLEERRDKAALESGVTPLATVDRYYDEIDKAQASMSRHPDGTRAKGLGKDYKGWWKVSVDRDRFGEAEFQSSRLRRARRAVLHAARIKRKKELRALLDDLQSPE